MNTGFATGAGLTQLNGVNDESLRIKSPLLRLEEPKMNMNEMAASNPREELIEVTGM